MGAYACSKALARLRAHLRDGVRTKNAGSVFEQRNALARLWAHLRDEVRTKNAGSVFEQRNALARFGRTSGMRCVIAYAEPASDGVFCVLAEGVCSLSQHITVSS
ncbi:hypothetical protein T296_09555 [Pantoea agglomerans Eh318]|nr:hypothetical protein T296_09555 [Pantoea agglomerans Eh318]